MKKTYIEGYDSKKMAIINVIESRGVRKAMEF